MSARRPSSPARLLDLTVGLFIVLMLAFLVIDLAVGRPGKAVAAAGTAVVLLCIWAVGRAAIHHRRG